MQVYGPSHIHQPQSIRGPQAVRGSAAQGADGAAAASDQLDISAAADAAAAAAEGDVRSDLVARVRQEIAAGSYETPERLDGAIERLLDEIG